MDGAIESAALARVIEQLASSVASLEEMFPERSFTLDGHIVGSLGEVVAAHVFGLELHRASTKGRDARNADRDDIEIKLTQRNRFAFRECAGHVIALTLSHGRFSVVYNGPGRTVWQACGKPGSNGQRQISVAKIKRLNAGVPEGERLPQKRSWAIVDD